MAAASSMPKEGTLITEGTASEVIAAVRELKTAVSDLTKAIANTKSGLAARIHSLTEKLDDVFDPEASIVRRAAVLSSIDRTLALRKSELAGDTPAAPTDSPSAERP